MEGAAFIRCADHLDDGVVIFNNAMNDCQSETGAFAEGFGGKERLEDSLLCFGVHAMARVADGKAHVPSRAQFGLRARERFIDRE